MPRTCHPPGALFRSIQVAGQGHTAGRPRLPVHGKRIRPASKLLQESVRYNAGCYLVCNSGLSRPGGPASSGHGNRRRAKQAEKGHSPGLDFPNLFSVNKERCQGW